MAECFLIHTGIIVWHVALIFGCCTSAAEAHEFLPAVPLPESNQGQALTWILFLLFAVCKSHAMVLLLGGV